MSLVLAWTLTGLLVGVAAPRGLFWLVRRGVDAALVLVLWALAVTMTVVAVMSPALAEMVHRCWLIQHHGEAGSGGSVLAVLSAVATGFAVVRGGLQLRRLTGQRHDLHARHTELAWLVSGARPGPGSVLWLPAADPLAYSVAGDPPLIVVTTGVRDRLADNAVDAVVAHERSHNERGHHLLVALAHAAAAGMGWLPLMRLSPPLIRIAVECDADTHAARQYGSASVRQALQVVSEGHSPAAALGMGDGEAVRLRLERLHRHSCPGDHGEVPSRSAAALCGAALISAVLVAGAFAVVTALTACGTA